MRRVVLSSIVCLVLLGSAVFPAMAAKSAADIKIGVTLVTLADPFFASLKVGLEAAAKEAGIKHLSIQDGQGDAARQLAQVENFIAQDYDIIIINPTESQSLVTAALAAKKAGIPVITMDRFLDTTYGPKGNVVAHVGADAVDGGRLGIRIVAQELKKRYGEAKGQILYIEGTPGSSTARDRTKGVEEELKKYPGIKVLARQPGETRAKAMALTENWLQLYPKVDAIYAYGGDGALGAVQAVNARGLKDVMIVGTGAAWDELKAIKEGVETGTVDFNPEGTGRDAIEVALKIINGRPVEQWVRTQAKMVTAENLK